MKNKFNVKTIDKKVIEVEGKLVNKPKVSKAPVWFIAFEKKIDYEFEKIEGTLKEHSNILEEHSNILKEHDKKFNKIESIFKRNNLK